MKRAIIEVQGRRKIVFRWFAYGLQTYSVLSPWLLLFLLSASLFFVTVDLIGGKNSAPSISASQPKSGAFGQPWTAYGSDRDSF